MGRTQEPLDQMRPPPQPQFIHVLKGRGYTCGLRARSFLQVRADKGGGL